MEDADLIRMYTVDMLSLMKISKKIGKSAGFVRKRLHENNVTMRKAAPPPSFTPSAYHRKDGYLEWVIYDDSPYYKMGAKMSRKGIVRRGRKILEHRLLMAKHLGRCLERWEMVHHINHDRSDNRIENLELMNSLNHNAETHSHKEYMRMKNHINMLEDQLDQSKQPKYRKIWNLLFKRRVNDE